VEKLDVQLERSQTLRRHDQIKSTVARIEAEVVAEGEETAKAL
jgi:hypothetical protein